jgi:hypothetical protein
LRGTRITPAQQKLQDGHLRRQKQTAAKIAALQFPSSSGYERVADWF